MLLSVFYLYIVLYSGGRFNKSSELEEEKPISSNEDLKEIILCVKVFGF